MSTTGNEYYISFQPENCTQCHGCEIACKAWRELEYGVQYRRVRNLWRGDYPEIRSFSLSLACLHCVEPACAAVCPSEAISKEVESGLVTVDEALCNGCKLCAEACPFGVPQFGGDGVMKKCDLCHSKQPADCDPPCLDTCPGKALVFVKEGASEKRNAEQRLVRLISSAE